MIAAWSVDRLGRSLQDLVGFLNGLQALGCNLYLHQQALDTTTPSGRAMFQMCGVFAELEGGHIVSTSSLDWNVAHAWCGCLKAMPQLINLRLVFGMPQQFTNRLAFANRGAGRLHAQRGLASPRAAHPS
jgi:hypothetical protein